MGAILSPHLKSATPINREHASNAGVRNYALVFFGCTLFHLAGTWSLPLIDRDEPRFAEASREMIERGDYIVPHFNNQFRLDKPPLAYWAQVASFAIFGQNDFAARFPSTIAAALIALSIFAWGSRIDGNRVGWWAAIIFTLSLQTFVHAKAAVADMWLVLFMTIAHWAGYELIQRPTPKAFASRQLNVQFRGTSNIKHQTANIRFLVGFLSVPLVRFSREGTDRVGAAVDGWIDNLLCTGFTTRPALQICAGQFAYARNRRTLGNPRSHSYTRRIFRRRNWSTRD